MKKVAIIGGGPAGMMAAFAAYEQGADVTLIEKNEKLGKKLYITGKGRCNITNDKEPDELIKNVIGNPYFLYSSFFTFGSRELMDFFENGGLKLKIERGGRVFPVSDKASDVTRFFEAKLQNKVKIMLNAEVSGISRCNSDIESEYENRSFLIKLKSGAVVQADAVIIATGGLSYPATGSTGDGYRFAERFGHTVIKLNPSLVSIKVSEDWIARLEGLSLKNIELRITLNGKNIYKDFGELMFTYDGISGPVVLSASRYLIGRYSQNPGIAIDLKPALSKIETDSRVLKDFQKYVNKDFKNALDDLLPQKLIPVFIDLSGIDPDKKVHDITKDERSVIVSLLKCFKLTPVSGGGFNEAVVTSGGICVDEINPSTMESKLIQGLYYSGEVIDVDALTGGYNLQIAFSTGYLAGRSSGNEFCDSN